MRGLDGGVVIGGREFVDLEDASGSMVDGVNWDGGGGGSGTMAGRRPRIYTCGCRRARLSVAMVRIWF